MQAHSHVKIKGVKEYDLDFQGVPIKSVTFIDCHCEVKGLCFAQNQKVDLLMSFISHLFNPRSLGGVRVKLVNSRIWIYQYSVPKKAVEDLTYLADAYSNIFTLEKGGSNGTY